MKKTMTIEEHPQSHEELFCNIVDAVGVFKRQIKKVIPLQQCLTFTIVDPISRAAFLSTFANRGQQKVIFK